LFRELSDRGYAGSRMTVERFLLGLRRMEQQGIEVSKMATSVALTPRRAVGLMLSRPTDRTPEESMALRQVCQIHPHVNHLNALFQQFAEDCFEIVGEKNWISGSMRHFIAGFLSCEHL
jgi:hypothetical protein